MKQNDLVLPENPNFLSEIAVKKNKLFISWLIEKFLFITLCNISFEMSVNIPALNIRIRSI